MNEEKIIKLTADLIEFTERKRISFGKQPVSYEIGTEETAGESISVEHFRSSLQKILSRIKRRGLPQPAFVVSKLYSNLKKYKLFENPKAYIMKAVKKTIMRYINAFNLRGSTSRILKNIYTL